MFEVIVFEELSTMKSKISSLFLNFHWLVRLGNECAQYWLYSAHYFGSNKSAWWTINCQYAYDCWTEKHMSVSVLKRKSLTHRFKLKFKSMSKACVLVFTVFKQYLDLQQYLSNLWATAPRLAVCFRWTFSEWIWSNCPLNQECLSNL